MIASNKDLTLRGADIDIAGITADSRKVAPGFLFVAIPGTQHDGRAFIAEALAKGAVAVLRPDTDASPLAVATVAAPDMRKAISSIAAAFYPRQPDTVVAVTGTSGKTSTAQFTREIWAAMGHNSASIGTLGLVTAAESRYGSLTTPDAITLHGLLDDCAGKGVTHLAMEASSHGLSMHRLDHTHLKAGGFTNFSRDHLDYHGDMASYLAAKLRLFTEVLPKGGTAVLNADIVEFAELAAAAQARGLNVISFGRHARELRLLEARPDAHGQLLRTELFGKPYDIRLPVIGGFQAWNALCALGMVVGSGGAVEKAAAALENVSGVPGRLQLAGMTREGAAVFVDYAHKPDALENVLHALRPHVAAHDGAKLGVVFGCGGNRDKGKRPIMGGIAQRLADWAIVTDDNPRHENPDDIRREILSGFASSGPQPAEIGDRAEAIAQGIARLHKHDILIIAGKGHEPGQTVGDQTLPFDDTAEAKKVLQA